MTEKTDVQIALVHAGPSVLVVDDEQDFVETLVKRMERRGFKVTGVGSGQEALLLLGKAHFDVVILDVMMPGMDGIETLREIKLAWPKIQVILLSGHGGDMTVCQGMSMSSCNLHTDATTGRQQSLLFADQPGMGKDVDRR